MDNGIVLVAIVAVISIVAMIMTGGISASGDASRFNLRSSYSTVSTFQDPVCGVDGNTYTNGCYAVNAGVRLAHVGACESIVCGDGICDDKERSCVPSIKQCETGPDGKEICYATDDCGPYYCPEDCQMNCLAVYDPVCGTDGHTYSNGCYAGNAGVNVDYTGECGSQHEPSYDVQVKPMPTTSTK